MHKTIFSAVLFIILFSNLQAQNVGINIDPPEYTFDVRGSSSDSGAVLNLENPGETQFLRLFSGQPNNPNPLISWHLGNPLRFGVSDSSGMVTERMRIRSGGTIGINNDLPQHPLHVNEPDGSMLASGTPVIYGAYTGINPADVVGVKGYSRPGDFFGIGGQFEGGWKGVEGKVNPTGNSSYAGVFGSVNGGTGTNYGVYGTATGSGSNYAGYFLNGDVYMHNKLGIGQPVPQWQLDMQADQSVIRMVTTTATNGSVIELKNLDESPAFLGAINFNNSTNSYPGQIAYEGDGDMTFRVEGATRLTISENAIVGTPEASFFNGTNSWNLALGNAENIAVFGAAGNATTNWAGYFSAGDVYVADELRIGTLTGANGYKVSVEGKIMCEELKVQLKANWPDYVFAKDYNLMPLTEVENEIKANHHLPGIPSASEMEENGIELGEMQRLLMEKVEELTLYVIELNKENQRMQNEINILSKRQ